MTIPFYTEGSVCLLRPELLPAQDDPIMRGTLERLKDSKVSCYTDMVAHVH